MYLGWKGGRGAESGLMRALVKGLQPVTQTNSRKEEELAVCTRAHSVAALLPQHPGCAPFVPGLKQGFLFGIFVTLYDPWGLELTLWLIWVCFLNSLLQDRSL